MFSLSSSVLFNKLMAQGCDDKGIALFLLQTPFLPSLESGLGSFGVNAWAQIFNAWWSNLSRYYKDDVLFVSKLLSKLGSYLLSIFISLCQISRSLLWF